MKIARKTTEWTELKRTDIIISTENRGNVCNVHGRELVILWKDHCNNIFPHFSSVDGRDDISVSRADARRQLFRPFPMVELHALMIRFSYCCCSYDSFILSFVILYVRCAGTRPNTPHHRHCRRSLFLYFISFFSLSHLGRCCRRGSRRRRRRRSPCHLFISLRKFSTAIKHIKSL